MKPFFILALILLPATYANAQFVPITNTSGTDTYEGVNITVTSGGSVFYGGSPCVADYTYYWLSPPVSTPGWYTYTCSVPIYAIQVQAYSINGGAAGAGEYLQAFINGSPYALTAADVTAYTECGAIGSNTCYIDSGRLMGPLGTSGANANGGDFTIYYCAGITSFELYCGNPDGGIPYNVAIDTTHIAEPATDSIAGLSVVCMGSSATFSDATSGGVWSISNTAIATVAPTGLVTAMTPGVDTLKYTITNSCGTAVATKIITVGTAPSSPGTISGPALVCVGMSVTLSEPVTGGVWSASNTHAAVTGGIVTGVTAGTDTISYTLTGSCIAVSATKVVTVSPMTGAGSITGPSALCIGSSITLSDTATGGVWSSSNPAIATIGTTGIVAGLSTGTDTIKYTVASSCGAVVAAKVITDYISLSPGPITGPSTVCVGASATLSDTIPGGTWSATNAHASVAGGIVTGISTGTDTIRYTGMSGCGGGYVTFVITVNPLPSPAPITGTPLHICPGASTSLASAPAGGTWSNSDPAVASITAGSSSTIVTGVLPGTTTIMYTVTNSCGPVSATATITVDPVSPVATISGPGSVCQGLSIILTDAATPGSWSATNGHAIVTSGGIVTGITAGIDTIRYSAISADCSSGIVTHIVTVNPTSPAGTISGPGSVCTTTPVTLTDTASGGIWSALNAHATVTAGVVTGITSGTDTIMYIVTLGSCTAAASAIMDVYAFPVVAGAIVGPDSVCAGALITLTDTATGGTWSSDAPIIATVMPGAGLVTGSAAGETTISYTVTNACGTATATRLLTVNPLPDIGTITGTSSICISDTATLNDLAAGGIWTGGPIVIIDMNGTVTGTDTGVTVISYSVTNGCGTLAATKVVTINPAPASITGATVFCVDTATRLRDITAGGKWSSSNSGVATVDSITGLVSGVSAGTTIITYTTTAGCYVTKQVTASGLCGDSVPVINSKMEDLVLFPNPASAELTITAPYKINCIAITNILGQAVFTHNYSATQVEMSIAYLPAGVYLVRVNAAEVRKFVKQ